MISKGNHVKFALFVSSVKRQKFYRSGFCDIHNCKGLGNGYPKAYLNPTSTLIILDITKTSSNESIIPNQFKNAFFFRSYCYPFYFQLVYFICLCF